MRKKGRMIRTAVDLDRAVERFKDRRLPGGVSDEKDYFFAEASKALRLTSTTRTPIGFPSDRTGVEI